MNQLTRTLLSNKVEELKKQREELRISIAEIEDILFVPAPTPNLSEIVTRTEPEQNSTKMPNPDTYSNMKLAPPAFKGERASDRAATAAMDIKDYVPPAPKCDKCSLPESQHPFVTSNGAVVCEKFEPDIPF